MKKSLIIKGLIALLIVFIFGLSAVSCDDPVEVDKTALDAELALEITAQGDYTLDSYEAYVSALEEAKAVSENEEATQEEIDLATEELTSARLALTVRQVLAVSGANKEISLISGGSREIVLADYINTNNLSNITYKIQANNDKATVSAVSGGKFTVTAGEVSETTEVKVSINVYHNDAAKLSVVLTVKITNDQAPTVSETEIVEEYDIGTLGNKESIVIDFAANVNNPGNLPLTYSVKLGEEELTLDGSSYTFPLGKYTEQMTYETFTVTVTSTVNGEAITLVYTYKLGLKDTGKYSIANGNFENGLEGWTFTNTVGEAPFAGIDNKTIYWVQEFPMNNVGSYFSAYAEGASEGSQGTLASPYFVARGEFATYMLGGAGNPEVYITIENENGEVLALYRNTKFADLPIDVTDFDAQRELVGVTVFLANFVTYKVDISAFEGEKVRFVVHDHASEGWGVVFFDELVTYYAEGDALPEGATLAENLLADKAALREEISLEIAEQGDYTDESFGEYLARLGEAKAILDKVSATQESVDNVTSALEAARLALAVRPVVEVEGASKSYRLLAGGNKEITLSDYINTNGLSRITYEIVSNNSLITVGSIVDGRFTITAGDVTEETLGTVTIKVLHGGEEKLAVEISVQVLYDVDPIVPTEEVVLDYDIFFLENKADITLDFSERVDNVGGLELAYSAKLNGEDITLDGTLYTFTFGSYDEVATIEIFTVTINYMANGKEKFTEFSYKLVLTDTSEYRVANGNFENGLEGWTFTNTVGDPPFAGIDDKTVYWVQEFPMNNVGKYFSSYADGASEGSQGTLASPYFTVNSKYATYSLGGAGNSEVYITIESEGGEVLAVYRNTMFADLPGDVTDFDAQRELIGTTVFLANFVTYKVDLEAYAGERIRFVIHDHASEGWGVVFFDELNTYYATEDAVPETAVLAENLMANKDALKAAIDLAITEQGDYTEESFNGYLARLNDAKATLDYVAATQAAVDNAIVMLDEARLALTVRPVFEVEGASKSFKLTSGGVITIVLANYVDTNGLSDISYGLGGSSDAVILGDVIDGVFTITAGEVIGASSETVTITVYYGEEEKLAVELTVEIVSDLAPTVIEDETSCEHDIFFLENKASLDLDLSLNVVNEGNLVLNYSVNHNGADTALDGSVYTLVLGEYTDEVTYETLTVTITCTVNGKTKTLVYTYLVGIYDTSEYRVANGGFDGDLEGWIFENTVGEAPFAGIDEKSTFWGEGYPMFNVGKYFSSYAEGASEASHGTLASPYFTVKSGFATYNLGGAGNHNVYITIENEAGEVLALYRNTRFTDFPAGDFSVEERRAMIGNTVFLANFVTYKVNISALEGQRVRFVIHDHASEGWGVVYFDELNTYHTEEPEGILAENLLANKSALKEELALEIAEQGDYTDESFGEYLARLGDAKAIIDDIAVTQETVDRVTANLTDARLSLEARPVVEVEGAGKIFRLVSGNSKEITISDYINTNGLSRITYEVSASNSVLALGEILNGKFTVTAGDVTEATEVTVFIAAYYNGEEKLVVEITAQITNDSAPTVLEEKVTHNCDVFYLTDKENIEIDLSSNVDNIGGLALSYAVNGEALAGSVYTFKLGGYNDVAVYETLNVTVNCTVNGEPYAISYVYELVLTDSTEYRLANGGFEDGLDGWNKVGSIGDVDTATHYWVGDPDIAEGYAFGMDGEKMFSAYAEGAYEGAVGTLTSSSFKVGGSGFVTFKLGAMKDGNYVYVDVVDAETKQILARYYNGLWSEFTDGRKSGCTLVAYKADLSEFVGREVFFRISDNADSGYGLFFADSFETYYENEPEGFNVATPVGYEVSGTIYDLFNGGFELGGVQGWWSIGEIGLVTNATGYWGDNIPYGKTGEYLFTGVESFGADTMREGNKGTLTSSAFELSGTGYVSFKLGGGGNALCYVQIIDAVTGEIIARYHQQAQQDAVLIQYVADLTAYVGRTLRIQVVDQATGGWGCVSFDDVVTYYPEGKALPEGHTANDIKYTLTNGSFEGGLDGWTMNITEAGAHNTLGWVESSEHDAGWYTKNDGRKDGNNLFTFCRPDGTNCENTKGNLQSASFVLKKDSYVSFRFGGAGTRDVHLQLVRADGTVIATFYNEAEGKINTEMFAYYYQYTGEETECFFRVVDNSVSNYGCFVVDDFRANLESAPEGFIAAIQ